MLFRGTLLDPRAPHVLPMDSHACIRFFMQGYFLYGTGQVRTGYAAVESFDVAFQRHHANERHPLGWFAPKETRRNASVPGFRHVLAYALQLFDGSMRRSSSASMECFSMWNPFDPDSLYMCY
jgi:hypothetical protein